MQFFWDPANESAIHTGDFNGDGRDDAVTVTSGGEAFVSFSNGFLLSAPVSWGVLGYHDDPSRTKGWWTFAFDFTGDGLADYVQLNEFGEIWVAESNGVDAFLQPVLNAPIGFEHKPEGPWQTFPAKVVP
jgi:hypothetical protein